MFDLNNLVTVKTNVQSGSFR